MKVLGFALAAAVLFSVALTSGASGLQVSEGNEVDLTQAVLSNPSIALTKAARADVESGSADPRVLAALLRVAQTHRLAGVGPIKTGHSYYVKGTTRVSNHSFGRAVDISMVDGMAVSSKNLSALQVVRELLSFASPLRPDEVGSPWDLPDRGSFSDAAHSRHIHFGHEG